MTQNYYSIVFDVTIHNTDKGNFAIPKGVCRLFYIRDQMEVDFVVDDLNRNIRSFQRSTTSGQEIRIGTSAYLEWLITSYTLKSSEQQLIPF